MEYAGLIKGAIEKGGEIYGDYQRGRSIRLGEYGGMGSVKNIGVYNKKRKHLGVYNG